MKKNLIITFLTFIVLISLFNTNNSLGETNSLNSITDSNIIESGNLLETPTDTDEDSKDVVEIPTDDDIKDYNDNKNVLNSTNVLDNNNTLEKPNSNVITYSQNISNTLNKLPQTGNFFKLNDGLFLLITISIIGIVLITKENKNYKNIDKK